MNKTQLVNNIAASTGVGTAVVVKVLDEAIDLIQKGVAAGDKVQIVGFGSFEPSHRAARTMRLPGSSSGETVEVPAKTVPVFKPGSAFKAEVNAGQAVAQ